MSEEKTDQITAGQLVAIMLAVAFVSIMLTSIIWSAVKATPTYVGVVNRDEPAPQGIITTVAQSNGYNISFGEYDGTTLPATLVPLNKQLGDVTLVCEFFDRDGYSLGTDNRWFPPSPFSPKKITLTMYPVGAVRSAKCFVR